MLFDQTDMISIALPI